VSNREQRASWYLEDIKRHIERGTENLDQLAKAYSESEGRKRAPYDLAWEFIDLAVPAVVRKDAGRLLRTVNAVVELSHRDSAITADELREVLVKHLLGEDLWEEDQ
jgi:hypothetical protein